MSFGRPTAIAITCVLSLAVLVLSALMLIPRLAPGLPASLVLAAAVPIAEPHGLAADAAHARNPLAGQAESVAELRVSPTREDAWLRLAQVDAARHGGRLGPDGLAALASAYDVEPYELGSARARRDFVLRHLADLTPDLRAQVEQELSAVDQGRPQAVQRPAS